MSEIKRFFGLILWMGLVKLTAIHQYWSNDPAYMQTFPKKTTTTVMVRLFKIQPVIDTLETNYQKYYNPSEDICIDESLVPFRGRIIFRQYLK
ncbi:piggyBac transposable element-derived protein 4-like [Vespa velutina]|uniref:piggyBac transposable element-derived protein 4-like n=1 Tax=Vespa velutina TaxID=202808 RepID=UPI001FB55F27|nr:piggyBac transposable element-derived protein 4-like [Vespa velutina]